MAKADTADIAKLTFEEAMRQLEDIVGRLESGKVELEDSIAIYERGAALKSHCERKLKDAEARIEKIVLDSDGKPASLQKLDAE
jgi:exodeoxyribonuclease VII small subunit